MIKQKSARRLTDKEIESHVSRAGEECSEYYHASRDKLFKMLNDATEDGKTALAGFMFAFTSISNEIAKRNNIK